MEQFISLYLKLYLDKLDKLISMSSHKYCRHYNLHLAGIYGLY